MVSTILPTYAEAAYKWINGAQSYETLAGVVSALEYLAMIGCDHPEYNIKYPELSGRRRDLKAAMTAIQDYETALVWRFIDGMRDIPQYRLWGITDKKNAQWRVSPISVSLRGEQSNDIGLYLAENGVNIWSRSVYSSSLSQRLRFDRTEGFIRVGFVHYNTQQEVDLLLSLLDSYRRKR